MVKLLAKIIVNVTILSKNLVTVKSAQEPPVYKDHLLIKTAPERSLGVYFPCH